MPRSPTRHNNVNASIITITHPNLYTRNTFLNVVKFINWENIYGNEWHNFHYHNRKELQLQELAITTYSLELVSNKTPKNPPSFSNFSIFFSHPFQCREREQKTSSYFTEYSLLGHFPHHSLTDCSDNYGGKTHNPWLF